MNIKSILYFSIGPIGAAALSFITLPIITWIFSSEDVGRIALLHVTISFVLMIFTLGTDQAFIREFHESNNKHKLFNHAMLPNTVILFACLLFVFIMSSPSMLLFDYRSLAVDLALFISVCCAFLSRYFALVLRMQERGLAFSMCQFLPKLIFLFIILYYFFALEATNFESLILAHMASLFTVTCVSFWHSRAFIISSLKQSFSSEEFKKLVKFGGPLVFGGVAFWGLTTMDKLFLRKYADFNELAIYSVATSFAAVGAIFQSVFSTVWAPVVYKWAAQTGTEKKIDQVTAFVSLIVTLIFAIVGMLSWLVLYILPDNYYQVQYIMVCCLAYPLFYTLSETTVVGIALKKKTGYSMIASIVAFIINFIGNYLLVPLIGAKGAAISTAFSFVVFLIIRTEFSVFVWRSIPRFKLYILAIMSFVSACVFVLFGTTLSYWFIPIWGALSVFAVILHRAEFKLSILFFKSKLLRVFCKQ